MLTTKDGVKERRIEYNSKFVFHDRNKTDPHLESIITELTHTNQDTNNQEKISKTCETLLNIDLLIEKVLSWTLMTNDQSGHVNSIKDNVFGKIKEFSDYFGYTNYFNKDHEYLLYDLTEHKESTQPFQTDKGYFYDLALLNKFSKQNPETEKLYINPKHERFLKIEVDSNGKETKKVYCLKTPVGDIEIEVKPDEKKDETSSSKVMDQDVDLGKDCKKVTTVNPKEESKILDAIKETRNQDVTDQTNKPALTQEENGLEYSTSILKSKVQTAGSEIPTNITKKIKRFFANLAASLILVDPTVHDKPTEVSIPNMVLNVKRPIDPEKDQIYTRGKHKIKDVIGITNFLASTEVSELDKTKFIELAKKNDPRAKRIARNYSTLHHTPLMKDNAFLKVYMPNKTSANSSTDYKKDLEVTITKILLDKGFNVPKMYCDANIRGLEVTMQERVQGTELSDFIINKPHQKNDIISTAIGQLAKIHYHIAQDGVLRKKLIPPLLEKTDYTKLFVNGFLNKIRDTSVLVLEGNDISLLNEAGEKYEIQVKCEDKKRLEKAFKPISNEISKIQRGVYIDSNPANILIDQSGKVYNVDFENVKTLPVQFDLAILSAGLGLSDDEQTQVVNKYLEYKSRLENKEYNKEEKDSFHREYNLVSILRNLTLAGNMRDYIIEYNEKKALKDQLRYIKQAKQAIDRALNSDVMSKKDKKMINQFKQEFEKYQVTHSKIEPNSYSVEVP